MTQYRRKPADATMLATALGAGAAIGAATFYLVKLWLQRDSLDPVDPAVEADEEVEKPGISDPEASEGAESSR